MILMFVVTVEFYYKSQVRCRKSTFLNIRDYFRKHTLRQALVPKYKVPFLFHFLSELRQQF